MNKQRRLGSVKVDVHGIVFEVCLGKELSFSQLFPLLQAFPRSPHAERSWKISVDHGSLPPPISDNSWKTVTELTVWPSMKVEYRVSLSNTVVLSAQGAWAVIYPDKHMAVLCTVEGFDPLITIKLFSLAVGDILRLEKFYVVHAAALEFNGTAVMVCAPSGYGKSTLSTAWARQGKAGFLSDDRCLLQMRDGCIHCGGIAEPIALGQESRVLMERLPGPGLPEAHERYDGKRVYDTEETFGVVVREMLPVSNVLILDVSLTNDAEMELCPPSEAADRLIQGSFYQGANEVMRGHFETVLGVLSQARSWKIPAYPELSGFIPKLETVLEKYEPKQRSALRISSHAKRRQTPAIPGVRFDRAIQHVCKMVTKLDAPDSLIALNEVDWKDLLKAAEHHGLLPSVGNLLCERDSIDLLSHGLQNVVLSSVAQAAASRSVHLNQLCSIAKAMDAAGLKWCVIKGPSIAERYYENPAARTYGDIDLMVAPHEVNKGMAVLEGLGFLPSSKNLVTRAVKMRGDRSMVKYLPAPYTVELHWDYVSPGALRQRRSCDIGLVLERSQLLDIGETNLNVPSTADQLVGACVHAAVGHQWDCLAHLLDIAYIAEAITDSIINQVRQEARRLAVVDAVALTLAHAADFFPTQAMKRLADAFGPRLSARAISALTTPRAALLRPWERSHRMRRKVLRALIKYRVLA